MTTMTKTQENSKSKRTRIEKNVPLPKYTKLSSNTLVEDLKVMEPLDSMPLDVDADAKTLNATRTRMNTLVKKYKLKGRKFTVNYDPKNSTRLRVWRVS